MRGARDPRHDGVHHGRRQRLIDDIAKEVLQTIANLVKARQDYQGDAGSEQQHQQRLAAVVVLVGSGTGILLFHFVTHIADRGDNTPFGR